MAASEAPRLMGHIGAIEVLRPNRLRPAVVEALYAEGWAFDQRLPVVAAELAVGMTSVPALAVEIERPDVAERFRRTPWRSAHAGRSGLLVGGAVGPLEPGRHELALRLELADGAVVTAACGDVLVGSRGNPEPLTASHADVAVLMATYDPPVDLFRRQVDSIRRQDHPSWVCILCDDHSPSAKVADLRHVVGDDDRFVLVENARRVGFYLNFERGLAQVPADARYVALADQDDVWHPEKLSRQVGHLERSPDVQLVASDVRLTDVAGVVVSPTFYAHRSPTHDDPYSLFVVNSLIGASMVFRRELLDIALPFPRAWEDRFHDHWLARSALVTGTVDFVTDPLHDYTQHGANVFGSRDATRWPLRPTVKTVLRRWIGSAPLPSDWRDRFVNTPMESAVAADVLVRRCPSAAALPWLRRFPLTTDGQLRELSHIVADHAIDRRAARPRREGVEISLFTGRSWQMRHQPRSVRA